MLTPAPDEELAKKVAEVLARVRSRHRKPRSCERDVTTAKVACARQTNFAARYTPIEADIVIDTPRRGRVLVVEVTWFREPSVRKAIGHRDIRTPYWTTNFEYFMLVLRGDVYLWRRDTPPASPPDFSAPVRRVWCKYLGYLAERPETLRAEVMQIAIASWLHDLANGIWQPNPESEADQMLLVSGLYDLMKNANVRTHVIA
jgi:hypothetical protein